MTYCLLSILSNVYLGMLSFMGRRKFRMSCCTSFTYRFAF